MGMLYARRQRAASKVRVDVAISPDRSQHFVGREHEMEELQARFRTGRRLALVGPPGIGKTQLALGYIHRYGARYQQGAFWLRGDNRAILSRDFASLADRLNLVGRDPSDRDTAVIHAGRWLLQETDWLLVLDNLENVADLEQLLPRGIRGNVLVTSRHPVRAFDQMEVGPLPSAVATRFLVHRTQQDDETAAASIVTELGCLPLALEQAGAYMVETGESLTRYHALLRERPTELLAQGAPTDYPSRVVSTLTISIQRVRQASQSAADLLSLCAFLAPDDIPIWLLAGVSRLDSRLAVVAGDPLKLNMAISVLRDFSMLGRHNDSLNVHRLVQTVIREEVLGGQKQWADVAIRLLLAEFPASNENANTWPACARLLPHALVAVGHASNRQKADVEALRRRVSDYLMASTAEQVGRALHASYLEGCLSRGETIGSRSSLQPWDKLPYEVRESNLELARKVANMLDALNCALVPHFEGALTFAYLTDDEVLQMARMEHDRWMSEWLARGLVRGSFRSAREHPDLVPWEQLTEETRAKDIQAIRELPGLLADAGFQILRWSRP